MCCVAISDVSHPTSGEKPSAPDQRSHELCGAHKVLRLRDSLIDIRHSRKGRTRSAERPPPASVGVCASSPLRWPDQGWSRTCMQSCGRRPRFCCARTESSVRSPAAVSPPSVQLVRPSSWDVAAVRPGGSRRHLSRPGRDNAAVRCRLAKRPALPGERCGRCAARHDRAVSQVTSRAAESLVDRRP